MWCLFMVQLISNHFLLTELKFGFFCFAKSDLCINYEIDGRTEGSHRTSAAFGSFVFLVITIRKIVPLRCIVPIISGHLIVKIGYEHVSSTLSCRDLWALPWNSCFSPLLNVKEVVSSRLFKYTVCCVSCQKKWNRMFTLHVVFNMKSFKNASYCCMQMFTW